MGYMQKPGNFELGTGACADAGVCGGPGANSLQIPNDDCIKFEKSMKQKCHTDSWIYVSEVLRIFQNQEHIFGNYVCTLQVTLWNYIKITKTDLR